MQMGHCGKRVVSPPERLLRVLAACAVAALMAACATRAPRPVPVPVPVPEPRAEVPAPAPAGSRVLGRSERFVIYQPAAGDTLRSIAARFLGSESRD